MSIKTVVFLEGIFALKIGQYCSLFAGINFSRGKQKDLEQKLDYLVDGVAKVLEDGETMAIHLQHLRQLGRCWTVGCYGETIDLRQKSGITRSEAELSNSS